MFAPQALHDYLTGAVQVWPDQIALREAGKAAIMTYRDLDALSDRLRDRLGFLGIQRGDRVGIYLPKTIDAVAAIFGILKSGAAYVPVDPGAPPARNAYILSDCAVKAVVVEHQYLDSLRAALDESGYQPHPLMVTEAGAGQGLDQLLVEMQKTEPAYPAETAASSSDDLAYILYTSGSTGKPKGVMLTHRAAISFVEWCSEAFEPTADDCFSSHAPFHFDLSILDLYLPMKHGAGLVLIDESVGKDPLRLAPLIAQERITSWYSTPSILSFLAQYGNLGRYDYSALRTVLFAGEVFPIKHLRLLKKLLPEPRYFNLYGPTETNVCTYYEIPAQIPEKQTQPFPIGKACSHYEIRVVNEEGHEVPVGEEGELCASSPGMMEGYWNLPERTANAFLTAADGQRWYKTGDIVYEDDAGDYVYVGRQDRMVKKRGYRVELGEVEAGLYRHPAVKEAAVIALSDEETGVRLKAFLACHGEKRPSLIELKRFCIDHLPSYMVPDIFSFQETLPKTSTDKINYQQLKAMD